MQNLTLAMQSIIVLVSQLIFIYLRTVNVQAIAKSNTVLSILSGIAVGLTGLLSLAIGVDSVIDGRVLPVVFYLLGGSIGTYLAMKRGFSLGFLR